MPRIKPLTGIAAVAEKALAAYAGRLYPQAVKLVSPFPKLTPLRACTVSTALTDFVGRYEPRSKTGGLYPHQAALLKRLSDAENVLVTTATGSGKSLCFWAWAIDRLIRQTQSTALACFPTQALMWGQAERLARISEPKSVRRYGANDTVYSGTIRVGRHSFGWTVWFGVGKGANKNDEMEQHEATGDFKNARIRLATLDKAHWSLFRARHADYAARLCSLVLDESHMYHGVFGANAHYFLRRLYLATELAGQPRRPGVFLASATLAEAHKFAAQLLGVEVNDVVHIEDGVRPTVELIPLTAVTRALAQPPAEGLLRIALLLDDEEGTSPLEEFLADPAAIGTDANALYFSESKFHSKKLKLRLTSAVPRRDHVIYDADLPPEQRREIEQRFNASKARGVTLLATNALELGVDIEGLDVCVLDRVPPNRTSVVQRAGRVGRRADRPGLVLLRLSSEPHDRHILENPMAAFRLDNARPLLLPLHLELLRYKHALAAFKEWMDVRLQRTATWPDFNAAVGRYFDLDPVPQFKELKAEFTERFGTLVDTEGDGKWEYRGFRASASQGKIPLLDENGDEVARIETDAVFRDAHPEAVYLGHDLGRYRVTNYEHKWKVAEWTSPQSETVLGKWLPALEAVRVRRESKNVTTRGRWRDSFTFFERCPLTPVETRPRAGGFEFGVWDYCRKWDGYTEINLKTGDEKAVSLTEVSARFEKARKQNSAFPFLHNFSYRTVGWEWTFGRIETPPELAGLVEGLLEHFLADAVESSLADIRLRLNLKTGKLQLLDAAPGGNGISRALLAGDRIAEALARCRRQLDSYRGREGAKRFKLYVMNLCHTEPEVQAGEVANVIGQLRERWTG